MIPFVENYLLNNWEQFKLGAKPEALVFIKFAERRIKAPEVSVLSFLVKGKIGGREDPLFILRLPRYPDNGEAVDALTKEYNNLSLINKKMAGWQLLASVPAPLLYDRLKACPISLISFLPGKDLAQGMITKNFLQAYLDNFTLAFRWKLSFEKNWGGDEVVIDDKFIEKYVKREIELYSRAFPKRAEKRSGYLARVVERFKRAVGAKITIAPQHGDFHAANIFIKDGAVSGVIDWEDFTPDFLPCYDLFRYIKVYYDGLYAFAAYRHDVVLADRLFRDQKIYDVVRQAAENFAAASGVDPGLIDLFLPLVIIKTITVMGGAGKRSLEIVKRNELLLDLEPFSLKDVIQSMSAFSYAEMFNWAIKEGDHKLADLLKKRIDEVRQGVIST